jgi:hypothetical protein
MKKLRSKMTYANVISTFCLFLLLGGGAAFAAGQLPKNSVGTKQVKKNAITGAKVKDQSLTGKDIKLSKLGTVPSATHASTADLASALPPIEATHIVGAAGQPTFEGGSENYPAPGFNLQPIGFYKDSSGLVHLVGVAKPGPDAPGSIVAPIFTLPAGFRPAAGVTELFASGANGALVGGTNASLMGSSISGIVLGEEGEVTPRLLVAVAGQTPAEEAPAGASSAMRFAPFRYPPRAWGPEDWSCGPHCALTNYRLRYIGADI